MERRVLVAVFLSFLVLYGYQTLVPAPSPGTGAPAPPDADTSRTLADGSQIPPAGTGATPPASSPTTAQPSGRSTGQVMAIERPTPDPVVGDTAPREIVVESDRFRAVFSNRGGELVSWQLKDYLEEGRPVELIPVEPPPGEPWPFTLLFDDEDLTYLAHEALFQANTTSLRLDDASEKLSLEYEDASGLAIRKVFTFDPAVSPYVVGVTIQARLGLDRLEPTVRWGPAVGGVESQGSGLSFRQGPRGVVYGRLFDGATLSDPGIERIEPSDVATQPAYGGQLDFLGVDNHYFIAAVLPEQREVTISYRAVYPLPSPVPDDDPPDLMAFDLAVPGGVTDLKFYLGPKDFDILEAASAPLVRSIEFGWLSVLVVPLHQSLKWVYGWVGNYGFAIIVLTFLINIVIFPLRHKSVTSMRKMSEIQPEMKAIQERYAHLKSTDPDKQKMNQEVMALYRDRGVNPVSGCLPMLLTMPVLFAFYRLLSMSIEMRGAPFVLWITDLSVHDPMYVTPVIMGVSMLVQQQLTPSQADPMQQRIMMLMPIVFTFMFLWAPAGLVVYWLTSNLLGIGQQVVTNRIIGPPKVRVVRPPAERRVKTKKGAAKKGAAEGAESDAR